MSKDDVFEGSNLDVPGAVHNIIPDVAVDLTITEQHPMPGQGTAQKPRVPGVSDADVPTVNLP